MRLFSFNLLLALAWSAVAGEISPASLGAGFVVGFIVLWVARPVLGENRYHVTIVRAVAFFIHYLVDLILSGARVAHDIVTPTSHMRPGIFEHTLEARTDAEITVLANLLSLTPGTLSLDVSEDRTKLIVHSMFVEEDKRQLVKLEARVLRLLRGTKQ